MRIFLALFIFLAPLLLQAKETICLNMIVKNEKRVIKRCLESVKPIIDYWVILDTGSTDGTQEIIKEYMKDIPGELHERPWRNFGESRTEALEFAKGKAEYILFMDADDTLQFDPGFKMPALTQDYYEMWRGVKGFSYLKPQLVRDDLPLRWVGVTHEYLDCSIPHSKEILEGVRYVSGDGGASSYDPKKFIKNVKLLKQGLKREPNNARYAFYLAESYRDAGAKGYALEWYQKRANMGGWDEEVYWSYLQIGHMLRDIGLPKSMVIEAYQKAHSFRPHRVEALYYLAEIYNQQNNYSKAYELLKARNYIAKPAEKDLLFNEDWVDEYGLLFQLSICSYYLGHYQESLDACDKLLAIKDLPSSWKKMAETNRTFPVAKLQPKKDEKAKPEGPMKGAA